jgi:hypothetical protein
MVLNKIKIRIRLVLHFILLVPGKTTIIRILNLRMENLDYNKRLVVLYFQNIYFKYQHIIIDYGALC